MKITIRTMTLNGLSALFLIIQSCNKEPGIPVVTTESVTGITAKGAMSGGNVTSDGGAEVTSRGLCWSTIPNPTTADNKTTDGTGKGSFSSLLNGLTPGTTYYVRAYAINDWGTSYGNEIFFTTNQINNVTDADGNIYKVVTIGTQTWMGENLRTTHYNDASRIPYVPQFKNWFYLTSGAYCYYTGYTGDTVKYRAEYGLFYNWHAVNTGKLCPAGWHVPTYDEWMTLINFLGGKEIAGGKLKETGTVHWLSPNTEAVDEYNFRALPGGTRLLIEPWWYEPNYYGYFWASSSDNTLTAYAVSMSYMSAAVVIYDRMPNRNGNSVRCIMD